MQNILIQFGGNLSMITAIAAGGAVGAVMRYGVFMVTPLLLGAAFPYNTIIVNIVGSFFMGVFVTYFNIAQNLSPELKAFLTLGLLGGFTTFSAFTLDFLKMWESEQMVYAMLYVLTSVIFSILAIFGGVIVAKTLIA